MMYSNFRKEATFTDWPSGSHKTKCVFAVESNKKGERASRVTLHPKTGCPNAPKYGIYGLKVCIADGEDGKTYILSFNEYGFINVRQWNLQTQQEGIFDTDPRFAGLLAQLTN